MRRGQKMANKNDRMTQTHRAELLPEPVLECCAFYNTGWAKGAFPVLMRQNEKVTTVAAVMTGCLGYKAFVFGDDL